MLSFPLTNSKIQNYYQNEPKFNGVYWRNNLPKIKDGTYIINPDEFKSIGTHWIALHWSGTYSKRSQNIYRKQKYLNKYLKNTSIRFDSVWILLYWIYWFYGKS